MQKSSWRKIKIIFNHIIELPENEQESYLEEKTQGNPELYKTLKEMLKADRSTNSKITQVVSNNIEQLYTENFSLKKGDKIGVYEIKCLIGQGGMGAVFEAHRMDNDFEQTVAIKIIQSQNLNQETLNRFQSERQILANLNHPNIAHLLDGGTTDNGLPYLVMEYVAGMPILDYCKKQQLTIEQRIQLFIQVCNAVSYAHQNLIVHRDIKPGNILVNEEGQVKLLDFGIAKVLEPESFSQDVVETRIETRLLSLENASPEQVLGKKITTQTDVYTLGNLLYQLLTEETLFQIEKHARIELERAICETQPVKPSTIVSLENSIISHFGSIQSLKKSLKGDLDNITLKALQKEPENRYTSVEHLVDDIDRYLNNYPVRARPEKLSYQLRKFIRRNRLPLSFSILFIITIIGFSISLAIKSVQIEKEKQRAIEEAKLSQQTTDFLIEIFSASDPNVNAGKQQTAYDLLKNGEQQLSQLNDQPKLKAPLSESIARVYDKRGDYKDAIKLYKQTLTIKQHLKSSHDEIAETLAYLAESYFYSGNYDLAEKNYIESLKLFNLPESTYTDLEISTMGNLALLYTEQGKYQEAKRLYKDYLKKNIDFFGKNSMEVSISYTQLAQLERHLGNNKFTEQYLRKSLKICRGLVGDFHLETAHRLNQLASTLYSLGKYQEALPLAKEGLKIRQNIHQQDHIEVGASLGMVSNILVAMERYDEGIKYREQAIHVISKLFGESHQYYPLSLTSLGNMHYLKGASEKAKEILKHSLALSRKIFTKNHPNLAVPLTTLARIALQNKDLESASDYLLEAYQLRKHSLPENHLFIAEIATVYAKYHYLKNQLKQARSYLKEARRIINQSDSTQDRKFLIIEKELLDLENKVFK